MLRVLADDLDHNPRDGCGIILNSNGISHIFVHGDMDATGIMLRNLLENALLHGRGDMPVQVTVLPDGRIDVINDCPALAPDILARLTSPFVRGGTGTPGSGLGLAIASNIARQMDATVCLRSPLSKSGRGFGARITFPDPDVMRSPDEA